MGKIDLDPCADDGDPPNIPAANHFTEADDGLSRYWCGRIFMNPPYGVEIIRWAKHLLREVNERRTTEAVVLVPSRTDTQWFRLFEPYWRCLVRGRLKFGDGANSAPFPSVVIYIGPNVQRSTEAFDDVGTVYPGAVNGIASGRDPGFS